MYLQKLDEISKLQNNCSSSISRQRKRLKEISQRVKECSKGPSDEDAKNMDEIKEKIKMRSNVFFEMEAFLPKKNGLYLSLVLGNVNVTLLSKQSKIKGWWVFHHYVSTFLSGVMLTWPDGNLYKAFRNQFLAYCLYQSFVQCLQCYYQSGCLYRLRALGERHNMDLTVEGFQSWMWKGLTFLLPFLFFGHFWQLFNGLSLFRMAQLPDCKEWQVLMCGVCFLILFMGNFFTTLAVVRQKLKSRNQKPKSL
ncbi:transmembrane protein 120A-like isoform X3 [Seriola dumerili]|uniref:transmembrane protein 120A-like isoform X3 n=1 Tax=Seriola dumerili TaxID=41447 RepID=UPI000BBE7F00|nr:transmembrane protein 120A-like isoform X3 [Seriola dumerili]